MFVGRRPRYIFLRLNSFVEPAEQNYTDAGLKILGQRVVDRAAE
jgi:hypothetical protein